MIVSLVMMVCTPITGLRATSSCRSSWPPHRLGSVRPLLCTCSGCHSLTVGSPSPPSEKLNAPRTCGSDLKKNNSRARRGSIRLFPARRRSVSLLPRCRVSPASYRSNRLCRSVACGGARLRARTRRLSIAALPQLPKRRRANRRFPRLTRHDRPNSTAA